MKGAPAPALVYLAGALGEPDRLARWAAEIDRTACLALSLRPVDAHLVDAHLQRGLTDAAELAIRQSRICWLLWPSELSPRAFIELGYALAHRFHVARAFYVIVSGAGAATSVFTTPADYRAECDAHAFEDICSRAEPRP